MITHKSISDAVAALLKEKTGAKTYSNEVLENAQAPCFFSKVSEEAPIPQGGGVARRSVEVALNFFPQNTGRVRDEAQGLAMAATLEQLFLPALHIGDRFLTVRSVRADFGGENSDVLIFSFSLDFFDDIAEDTHSTPESITGVFTKTTIEKGAM